MERRVTERYIEAVARQRSLVVEHHGEGMSGHEGVVAATPAHPSSVPLLKEGSFGHHAASVHHTGAGQVRKSYCSVPFTQGALHSKWEWSNLPLSFLLKKRGNRGHNSPIYDECQTQLANVLALLWKPAHQDDSNDTPQPIYEVQVSFLLPRTRTNQDKA